MLNGCRPNGEDIQGGLAETHPLYRSRLGVVIHVATGDAIFPRYAYHALNPEGLCVIH